MNRFFSCTVKDNDAPYNYFFVPNRFNSNIRRILRDSHHSEKKYKEPD
jgi:hypothetical protein